MLDEVAIYGTALSTDRIQAHYQAGSGGSGVVAPERFWKDDSSGDWHLKTNWMPSIVPNKSSNTAIFGDAITSPKTVFTDIPVTVNSVQFVNNSMYTISGPGMVILEANTKSEPDLPSIDVLLGKHEFQTRVQLNNNTTITIASGTSLEFDNDLILNGKTLTKSGVGTMLINNALTANGGTINCEQGVCGGGGTIGGDLNNLGGTISPGSSSDALVVVPEPVTFVLLGLGWFTLMGGFRLGRSRRELVESD